MAVKTHRGGKRYSSRGNKVYPRSDEAGQKHDFKRQKRKLLLLP
jgi:hypothetical protein